MGLAETAQLAVRIGLDDKLTPGLAKANRGLNGFQAGLGRAGRGAAQLTGGLVRAGAKIAAIGVGAGAVAAKLAIDFEDAFAGIRKTVDEDALLAIGSSFDKLEAEIRQMATTMPIAATELARLGETAGALGVEAGSIDEFIKVTAQLGVTTNLTADEAADAFGRIGTILDLTGAEYEELADSIVALGNAGASTESEITEITKRFASEARAAGLLKEEIVGLASVTASLGFAPERGGTALARVFANLSTNIALGNDKGKAFAKITGETLKDLRRKVNKGETLPVFMDFLAQLREADPVQAKRMLAAIGVTNTSDRTIFTTMAQNLEEVNRQLDVAKNASGALSEEAGKRFDTLSSKIGIFKNQLIEVGINIGEGMMPAIERATDALGELLTDPKFIQDAKDLGKAIGDAIDSVNWRDVIETARSLADGLKPALTVALKLAEALAALPAEIKGVGLALFGLNSLSGGAIGAGLGNIVGGLGESLAKSLAARVPLFGSAFVQPVFVTNMGPGVGGGGTATPGSKSPTSTGGKLLNGALKLAIVGLVAEFADEVDTALRDVSQDLRRQIGVDDFWTNLGVDKLPIPESWPWGPKNTPTILPEVFGGNGLLGGDAATGRGAGDITRGEGRTRGGGWDPKPVVNSVTRLQNKLAAAIRQEERATRRGNEQNARQAANRVDRLRERLAERLNKVNNTTRNEGNQTSANIRRLNSTVRNKDLSVKVNVSAPVSVATYVRGVAVSTRYGGNFSVTAV